MLMDNYVVILYSYKLIPILSHLMLINKKEIHFQLVSLFTVASLYYVHIIKTICNLEYT